MPKNQMTAAHPRCQPFVHRDRGRIEIAMPVIRPDGRDDLLRREITTAQALAMASELLAGAAADVIAKEREPGDLVASDQR